MRSFLLAFAALAVVIGAPTLPAQTQTPVPHTIRGTVTTLQGIPVPGADVFVLESLDGAQTDSAGRFVLRTTVGGEITLVARRIGLAPTTVVIPADTTGSIGLMLSTQAATLVPITVQAGAYKAGNERGATLTALEVVTTPGATADVARAMQTLPGVQNVDEGTGLFVRGGDVSETKVVLNDVVMLSPYNYETPTGNFTVTVNPFLLDGIFFSSGGFGARYGNILSGVADLRTAGRPATSSETAVAGLASVSTAADLALSHGLAVHATAARNDTHYLFKLNGSTRDYSPAPNGQDFSGSVVYNYRSAAELKAFAIDRRSSLGLALEDPASSGGYSSDVRSQMSVVGWHDVFGNVSPTISASYATSHHTEGYGAFTLGTEERWTQIFTQTAWSPGERYAVRGGGDLDWRDGHYVGSLPSSFSDRGTGAPVVLFDSKAPGGRSGAFIEGDWRALEDLRLIAGVRTDYSSFTHVRTVDPRLSAAYKAGVATLTAAVGEYHQVSDPMYFAPGVGKPGIGPMSGRQVVAGGQIGEEGETARVEIYNKRYHDLVGLTRDKELRSGGVGSAYGADVFLKHTLWPFASGRVSYSYVSSRRTDPNTGIVARAPFDITHSTALILDQALPKGWSASAAFRYATGKPFTPVVGATYNAQRRLWTPTYGAPSSERMPSLQKVDIAMSRVTRITPSNQLVYFVSLDNVFDRHNLYQYTYDSTYTTRIPVRGLFNRSLYFGGSLTHIGR